MFKSLNNLSKISFAIGAFLLIGNPSVHAQISPEQTNAQSLEEIRKYQIFDIDEDLGQITNVEALQDVKSTDWAYESLKSLAERYNCLTLPGDKSNIFEGNKPLTRYEFAQGLNLCLSQIEKLINNVKSDFIKKDDLETLARLQTGFDSELNEIRNKLDKAESQVAKLEKNNFSDKIKLEGEVIFNITAFSGGDLATSKAPAGKVSDNQVMNNRTRVKLVYRLDERQEKIIENGTERNRIEQLNVRMSARNNTPLSTGTFMTRSGSSSNTNNNVDLQRLEYVNELLLKGKLTLKINIVGGDFDDIVNNYNPLFQSAGKGSISGFGRFATIYRLSEGSTGGGTGVSLDYEFSKKFSLSLAYSAPSIIASVPTSGNGLFNGNYSALLQLNFTPNDNLNLGFTYVNSYNNSGNVSGSNGSLFANQPFINNQENIPTSANHFGLEGNYKFSPGFTLGGWFGYTMATAETGTFKGQDANIMNWAVSLGFPQKNGNLLGFIIGMPPKVIDNADPTREDQGTSYHLEGLYRYKVNNNLSITPGVIVILNPEHNNNNDPVWVGTLRTTLTF